MKTLAKSEIYFKMIEGINYNNEHGGAYAYVQFLAYTRDVLKLLRPFQKIERQLDAIEGINWLFNECLVATFTHRQKAIFENKMHETKEIFETIRTSLMDSEVARPERIRHIHRQAA